MGFKVFSTGAIQRGIAAERGMSTYELNKYMETHPELDAEIDGRLVALSDMSENIIIDSRLAWHFVKDTFKAYLTVDPMIAAERVLRDDRGAENYSNVEEALRTLDARKKSETLRYSQKYGVDSFNLRNYDIVIDTSVMTPEEVAVILTDAFNGAREASCFLHPARLAPTAAAMAAEQAAPGARTTENQKKVGVIFYEGYFYIYSGAEIVAECFDRNDNKISCDIVALDGENIDSVSVEEYIKANVSQEIIDEWGRPLLSSPEWFNRRRK
jgi:cytidylate kinase